jgi:Rrf2 family protein
MLEIASCKSDMGIFQKDISQNQEISNKYLDQIIHALKTSQLIVNLRGKKSGYILTRKPAEITLYDIHSAFEPGICIIECLSGNNLCKRSGDCQTKGFWEGLNNVIINYFKSMTLQDLIENKIKIQSNILPDH